MSSCLLNDVEYTSFMIKERKNNLSKEEKEQNLIDWLWFFRNNLDIFIVDYLGIKLKPFQRDMILQMAEGDITDVVASRGLSKSFIVAIFAVAWSLLYAKTEVVIVSLTLSQANNIITEKIQKELCGKKSGLSKVLVQLMDDGWMSIKKNAENGSIYVEFANGSTIKSGTLGESLRGVRSTVLITDECCLVKKKDYEEIVEPTNRPRQIEGLPSTYREEPKQIFLSSAKSKTNWFYKHLKNCVTNHFKGGRTKYNFYFGDIYTAVFSKIQTVNQLLQRKKNTDATSFEQEYLNVFIGTNENSLFRFEDFEQNQILEKPFYVKNLYDIMDKTKKSYVFSDDCVRFIACDIALATGNENDASVFMFCSLNKETGILKIENLIPKNGLNTLTQVMLMKRYFYEYNASYCVQDTKGVGQGVYDLLTVETYDTEYGITYPAWTVNTEKSLQISSDTVINDKVQRTISDNCEEVLIPYSGTTELNSQMHFSLRKALRDKNINLLKDDAEMQIQIENIDSTYITKTPEEKAELINPFMQTRFLINEAISLEVKQLDGGNIKLAESNRLDRKDRYMTLGMANFLADKLRLKYNKDSDSEDFDLEDFSDIYDY